MSDTKPTLHDRLSTGHCIDIAGTFYIDYDYEQGISYIQAYRHIGGKLKDTTFTLDALAYVDVKIYKLVEV